MATYSLGKAIRRGQPGTMFFKVLLPGLILVLTAGYMCKTCYYDTYDLHLNLGKAAFVEMMEPKYLEEAGFFDHYDDPKPSDFVEFIDSEKGQALWPHTNQEWRDSFSQPELVESPERTLIPDHTSFSALEVDPSAGRQLVYIPHDDTEEIEIVGYLDPGEDPIYRWNESFPKTD